MTLDALLGRVLAPVPAPGRFPDARRAGPGDDDDDDDETPIGDPPDDDEGDDWDDEDDDDEEPLQASVYCAAAWPRVRHPGTMAP